MNKNRVMVKTLNKIDVNHRNIYTSTKWTQTKPPLINSRLGRNASHILNMLPARGTESSRKRNQPQRPTRNLSGAASGCWKSRQSLWHYSPAKQRCLQISHFQFHFALQTLCVCVWLDARDPPLYVRVSSDNCTPSRNRFVIKLLNQIIALAGGWLRTGGNFCPPQGTGRAKCLCKFV